MQKIEENVSFLRSVPLLKHLSNNVLAKIADVLEVVIENVISMHSRDRNLHEKYFLWLGILSSWCIHNSPRCQW